MEGSTGDGGGATLSSWILYYPPPLPSHSGADICLDIWQAVWQVLDLFLRFFSS